MIKPPVKKTRVALNDELPVKDFYTIAVCSNPVRYRSRIRLFRKFVKEMEEDGAKVIVVEIAYGLRPFDVTQANNRFHVQLRTESEIWHKENMINLGVRRLSQIEPEWESFAFVDADITFVKSNSFCERENWISETVEQLQLHQVVQLFQTAIDLGPNGEAFAQYDGFAWAYVDGRFKANTLKYTSYHPGYAWAMRRSAYDALGGLIQTGILGAGDRHMAYGLIGKVKDSIQKGTSPGYAVPLLAWQERAERFIQRDIGYVKGSILHHFHGPKQARGYHTRWAILEESQFDPATDLRENSQGLLELVVITPRQMKLRDDIRRYLRSRDEDSISI